MGRLTQKLTLPEGDAGSLAGLNPGGEESVVSTLPRGRARGLSTEQFVRLKTLHPVLEFVANIPNPRTRKAYLADLQEFSLFCGIETLEGFAQVERPHVIAWRESMTEATREGGKLADATVRRKLSALSKLFQYLCEHHGLAANPVLGVGRPKVESATGLTPAISDEQAAALLDAPSAETLKGVRDRAILAALLFSGMRREELCRLRVRDYSLVDGVLQYRIHGKGGVIRFVPVNPLAQQRIEAYLDQAGHRGETDSPLFRPVTGQRSLEQAAKGLHPDSLYHEVVRFWGAKAGINERTHGFCAHSLRVTAATNAIEHEADLLAVKDWLGHKNVSTTQRYVRDRGGKIERSPSFKVRYDSR